MEGLNGISLTKSFCTQTSSTLVFYPESDREAAFIVGQLNEMGFQYYRPEYADKLKGLAAAGGSIYLDTDKTIMVVDGKREGGILCATDSFENFFIPEIVGSSRINAQDVMEATMVFYPRSTGEARAVVGALLAQGAKLEDESQTGPMVTARAVTQGVLVKGGLLSFAPQPQVIAQARIMTSADLGVNPAAHMSAEQITIMAAFNEVTARMMQLSARIERLEGEILPATIDKTPPRPAGGLPKPKR